jgi:hypothetical protein
MICNEHMISIVCCWKRKKKIAHQNPEWLPVAIYKQFYSSPMAKSGVVSGIWCPALLSFLLIRSGNNHLKIVRVHTWSIRNNVCNLSSLLYLAQSHFTVLRTSWNPNKIFIWMYHLSQFFPSWIGKFHTNFLGKKMNINTVYLWTLKHNKNQCFNNRTSDRIGETSSSWFNTSWTR